MFRGICSPSRNCHGSVYHWVPPLHYASDRVSSVSLPRQQLMASVCQMLPQFASFELNPLTCIQIGHRGFFVCLFVCLFVPLGWFNQSVVAHSMQLINRIWIQSRWTVSMKTGWWLATYRQFGPSFEWLREENGGGVTIKLPEEPPYPPPHLSPLASLSFFPPPKRLVAIPPEWMEWAGGERRSGYTQGICKVTSPIFPLLSR